MENVQSDALPDMADFRTGHHASFRYWTGDADWQFLVRFCSHHDVAFGPGLLDEKQRHYFFLNLLAAYQRLLQILKAKLDNPLSLTKNDEMQEEELS